MGFTPGIPEWYNIRKSINIINHKNKSKDKNHKRKGENHMITSIDAEKGIS